MELPFAVTEESNNDDDDNSLVLSSSASASASALPSTSAGTTVSVTTAVTTGGGGGGGGSMLTSSSSLLQSVALYDNVHTEHFYTPTTTDNATSTNHDHNIMKNVHRYDNTFSQPKQNQQQQNQPKGYEYNDALAESTFVTIKESDTNDYYFNDDTFNEYSNILPPPPSSSSSSVSFAANHHNKIDNRIVLGENVSMTIQSYTQRQKQQNQNVNKNKNQRGHQSFDILSLLISSCCDDHYNNDNNYNNHQNNQHNDENENGLLLLPNSNSNNNNNDLSSESKTTNYHDSNINHESIKNPNSNQHFIQLCNDASHSASSAKSYAQKGDISKAITQHLHSAKLYKEAALYLKRNFGNDLVMLAYSLLMLSNAQQRIGNSLLKSSCFGHKVITNSDVDHNAITIGNKVEVNSGQKVNHHQEISETNRNKENRLRAKIRASMNTAEADMTESTFLSKGGGGGGPKTTTSSTLDNNHVTTTTHNTSSTIATANHNQEQLVSSTSVVHNNSVNPIDHMMELEKELRDMDMTLEMGVGLSSSTHNHNNIHNNGGGGFGGGSFCVVPSGSSYMASSMMWSSSIGGRAQQSSSTQPQQQQQQQQQGHQNSRSRANRVQTILDASSASLNKPPLPSQQQQQQQQSQNHTIIAPAPKQQPNSLEASYWGQGSILASSTTSLSNSMVGIRSPNILPPNQVNGMTAPANTKQLMKLLDSLKTLGDENAALLREVDEAQKARIEAKAAHEAMKQFKDEYTKRFGSLRAALDKFRQENAGALGNQNLVTKSDYVKSSTMMEMQKRDQLIKKLQAELHKTKTELSKEKADSKKKDDALRKYENFYREVKARSAQKAKQREEEQRKQQQMKK